MFKRFLEETPDSEYHFRSDIFPTVSDRDFWLNFQNETCVSAAEAELAYTWPIIKATDFMEFLKSGDRVIMEKIHFDRRNHLVLFVLAELKENKGRFLPQIVNGLFTICEETFWGLSAHSFKGVSFAEKPLIPSPEQPFVDLNAAETAEHLLMTITLLKEPLLNFCPEIIDRVEYELDRRIKTRYENHIDFWWMGYTRKVNNWNPWILSNILTVYLLAEKDDARKTRAIKKMLTEIQHYYDRIPSDGGCDEGPTYWFRAGASLFEFLYQLKCATCGKFDFFKDEKIGRIASYVKKAHVVKDLFINISDSHPTGKAGLMPLLFGFAKETAQADLMNFSAAVYKDSVGAEGLASTQEKSCSHTIRTMRRIIYTSQFLNEIEDFSVQYPLHDELELLSDLQQASLRKGALFLSAKGGHNSESHNHNDVGSFTFYDGHTAVLIDVGAAAYTRFTFSNLRYTVIPWTQSQNHNLPVVNDVQQQAGAEFLADGFSAQNGKIEISFAKAYPAESSLTKLKRTLTLHDNGMVCEDAFQFDDNANSKVTEVLVTALGVRIDNGAAIIDEKYRVCADCGTVETEFLPFHDQGLESNWNADGITRIMFSAEKAEKITISVKRIK